MLKSSISLLVLFFALIANAEESVIEGFSLFQGQQGQDYAEDLPNDVEVTYLGVSGYIIRRGSDAVMFGPSLTNPGFLALNPVNPISTDKEKVDKYLPDSKDVEWILVGHAHYDHLMDVPYIMENHAPKAMLLGSKTAKHAVAGVVDHSRMLIVNPYEAGNGKKGEWIYNATRSMRVLAIASEHSPHFMGIKMMQGRFEEDQLEPPTTSFGWREGQTYNYLLDFLKPDGSTAFRIYYQDSSANAPKGFIPDVYREEYPRVDLAIYCVAAFEQVRRYPEGYIDNNQPRHIIMGHWEDFFANVGEEKQSTMRFTSLKKFVSRVEASKPEDADWLIPDLFSTAHYPVP